MGNWKIEIEGLGIHHSGREDDADAFAIQSKDESRANRCVTDYFSPGQLSAQAFCTSWCCELLVAM